MADKIMVAFSRTWQWEYELDAGLARLVPEVTQPLDKIVLWNELGQRMIRQPRFAAAASVPGFHNTLLHHTLAVWSLVAARGGKEAGEYAALIHDVPEVCGLGDISQRLKPQVTDWHYGSAEAGVWDHLVKVFKLPGAVNDIMTIEDCVGLDKADKECGDYEYEKLGLSLDKKARILPRPELDQYYAKTPSEAFNVWLELLPRSY